MLGISEHAALRALRRRGVVEGNAGNGVLVLEVRQDAVAVSYLRGARARREPGWGGVAIGCSSVAGSWPIKTLEALNGTSETH